MSEQFIDDVQAPWVIVAGGFHERGGMDKANAALARYLLARGTPVHLVAHAVAPEFEAHPLARVHIVTRPAGSYLLGERLLAWRGVEVARAVTARCAGARVVVNGGNCLWPDINWVHSVHHAWPACDAGAPALFRARNRFSKLTARRRERRALARARLVVANSERTRRDLAERLGLDAARVRVVQLGSDAACLPATDTERAAARSRLGVDAERPVVAFVGALGHDRNKGFDTLLDAWELLCARGDWDAELLAAGGGRGFEAWGREVLRRGLAGRVRLLGFTERVGELLAASDLLVSPARYEAYGLNAHEAVCRGVPALVSARSGFAELYPRELSELLLPRPDDAADLARRLLLWRADTEAWRRRFAPLAESLRARTWDAMAAEFIAATTQVSSFEFRVSSSFSESVQPSMGKVFNSELEPRNSKL